MSTTDREPQRDAHAIIADALARVYEQHERYREHGDNVMRDANIASIAVTALKQLRGLTP